MCVLELDGAGGALIVTKSARGVVLGPKSPASALKQSFRIKSLGELIVFARAEGCRWDTVRDSLVSLSDGTLPSQVLEELSHAYSNLSIATATAVLRYYHLAGSADDGPVR